MPVYVSSEKEKVKAGQTPSGPQSQSPVAIAIYSPGSRADCHSADIGVAAGMEDGSLRFKHTGHLLRRREQSAWHDVVNLGQAGRVDGWLMQRGRDGRRAS